MKKWTPAKEAKLKELLKEYRSQSVSDSSHDITFTANLLEGHEGEQLVLNAITKGEVKRDFGSGKSGNVFVEYQSRGKSSGIETSEADYYIFLLSDEGYDDEVFIGIKRDRLKRIIDSIKWVTLGGDGRTSKGKLVKLNKLIKKGE